jgi:hypothetical protein
MYIHTYICTVVQLTFVFLRVIFRGSPAFRSSHVLTKDTDSSDSERPPHYSKSDSKLSRTPELSPSYSITHTHRSIGYRYRNPQLLTGSAARLMYLRVYDSRDISRQPAPSTLVLDLRITHDRMGSSADPSLNGHLKHPNNLDQSLNDAAADKIRKYRTDYNNRPPSVVSFMTPIASTSDRLHSEFVRLLFLQAHRETDRFFAASGVQLAQTHPGGQFHFVDRLSSHNSRGKLVCLLLRQQPYV